VNPNKHESLFSTCQCGQVKFESFGTPILTGACYCASCQEAGRQFELLAFAPSVLDSDGGTDVILYRKDRVHCVLGLKYLEDRRLKPKSPTRRVVATCCNSAMFLDFTKGHWLSMYRNRFPISPPPLQMRLMTKYRRAGAVFDDDIPSYSGLSIRLMFKLLAARVAMGLHSLTTAGDAA
jgi:hypothetical protein